MNIFLRSFVSIIVIFASFLSPISPFISQLSERLASNEIDDYSSEIVEESISNGEQNTLEDEFNILYASESSSQEITPTPSETLYPTPEPTPTATEIPFQNEIDPELIDNLDQASDIELTTDKDYLVAGEDVVLNIDPKLLPEGAEIVVEASQGLSPKTDFGNKYNAEKNTVNLPLQAQSVSYKSNADVAGPYYFIAKIILDGKVLSEQLIALDQAVKGHASPQGGGVHWSENGVSVTFSKGAVDKEADLIIRQAYAHPIAPYNLSGHSVVLEAVDAEGNEITSFDSEVTLNFVYDPEEFAGNENVIFIRYFDEEKGDWSTVPTERDIENHIVSATISHFSEWDLEAGSWEAARLPNLDNFNEQGFTGGVSFNFPIDVPVGPGGFSPKLNLSYNSSTVDGLNIYTQAGWAGMGWDMNVGSIVRNQHGTANTLIDDTFNLNLGGVGGLLIKEEPAPGSNIVNYHLQDENFLRIEYYKTEDVWIVWDNSGTQYIFGGLRNEYGNVVSDTNTRAFYPTVCDGPHAISPTWDWGLRQIVDNHGQKIDITWDRIYRLFNDYCGAGTKAWVVYDHWPTTISYPDDNYQILLESSNNRLDYDMDWHIGIAYYTRRNLDKITIQKYENDQWVTAWYYDLIYAQDIRETDPTYDNYVLPNYQWYHQTPPFNWHKTLTLVKVKKCYAEGICDPEYSFEYGDGMHITAAENGQGGRVEYTYDPAYEIDSSPVFRVGSGRLCGRSGADGTFGWNANCRSYDNVWYMNVINSARNYIKPTRDIPGAFYRYFARVSISGHGDPEDWFKALLSYGSGTISDQSDVIYLHNSVYAPKDYVFYLRSNPEILTRVMHAKMYATGLEYCPDPNRTCHGMAAFYAYVQAVTTRYRIIEKKVIDLISGDDYSYTYTYDEFATNDIAHSENVNPTNDHCGIDTSDTFDDEWQCYERIYTRFRGHASSTVTDPSGRTTINYYHQNDILQGKPSADMTVVSQFGDNFENGLSPSQWAVSLSGGASDIGDVERHYGDSALRLTEGEPAEWSGVTGTTTTSPDGRSVIVQFMPQAGSEFNLGVQNSSNPNYKWRIIGSDSGISAQYGDGSGLTTAQTLIGAEDYESDQWYVAVFTLDHDDGYAIRIWQRDDPSARGFYTQPAATGNFTSGMTWQFTGSVSNGTIYFDEYIEAYLYAINLTEYGFEDNPNGIIPDPPNYYRYSMNDFPGFDVHWAYVTTTESYIFEGGSAFQATRTEYTYGDTLQYGNVTGIREKEWVNGTGFVNVRQTNIDYFPTDTTTTYLVSLPAQQTVYGCSGAICDQDLLTASQYIYDTNTAYNQAPITGDLTRTRQGVDDNLWADTLMTYDAWGNQISSTQYTSYGTDVTFASLGAQTTTTTYDAALHTYPVTVTPAIASNQITMTYDTLRGLPEAMTDPNGLVTLLCYDNKARLTGSVKGDSATPPTCGSQMEISITYHEATETSGVWSPFWTEASQVLSLDAFGVPDLQIGYRKFYDGIGRQIQTQTVGVDLDGYAAGSQSIINDFFYNPNGLLEFSSMPYNIATPAGYHTPPACTTNTCVSKIYDALSREIETQAPDGSVSQTAYGLDATEGLRTVTVADTLQNNTTSYQDVWGQTVRVVPETGPWTEYDYDLAGQMIQVDQVNGIGVFASTYMAYDLGGRKLEMSDPDMGVWTYDYDALGNLTHQTDANLQDINLCYDDLNRLTGKFYGVGGDCSTPAGWDVTYYYDAYTAGIFSSYTGPTTNALGQRTGMLDSSGQTIWSYEQRGNMIQEEKLIGTETFTTEWVYSIGGLLEQMAYPLVNGMGESIYTTYTPQGGVASVGSLYNTNISLTYDEAGRAVNRTYYSSGDGLQTNFDYYDWNEQVSTVPQGGLLESSQTGTLADADSLVSLAYIYDAVGNVASITDLIQSPAQVQAFGYDSLYRLASATGSAGFGGAYSETYTYDTQGRMDSKAGDTLNYAATRTGTCQTNTLTPAASSTITHAVSSKSGGNTYTYDCNGNAITRGDQTLIYDEENRLVEVQENSVTIAEYEYDGDGNRVKATVTGGELTITTLFIGSYYEQIVTDDGISSTTEWKKYYYAGSVRLAMREDSDDPMYLIGDHLGSTSLVLDTSGLEVAKRSYLPFGEAWGVSATDLPTTFTYTGQREAAEIGLMYYVARWYDSEIGHFIQADTIVPGAGNAIAWNRYAYVSYNPLNYSDPNGHCLWYFILKIIAKGVYNTYQDIRNSPAIDSNNTPLPTSTDMTEWLVDRLNENRESDYAQTLTESFDNLRQTDEVIEGLELWVGLVQGEAEWDYKVEIGESGILKETRSANITLGGYSLNYQAIANINYGYMGGVVGLRKQLAMGGAGLYQIIDHTDNLKDNIGGPSTYFDDPADNYWIRFGYYIYGEVGNERLTVSTLTNYLNEYIDNYGAPPEPISPGYYFTE